VAGPRRRTGGATHGEAGRGTVRRNGVRMPTVGRVASHHGEDYHAAPRRSPTTRTRNNPLGLLSFDAGFMNTQPTFGQRTMTMRFADATGQRVGFARERGSRRTERSPASATRAGGVSISPPSDPLLGNYGAFVTTRADGEGPLTAPRRPQWLSRLATAPTQHLRRCCPRYRCKGCPFRPAQPGVLLVAYQIDEVRGNTAAVWAAMGSPATPAPPSSRPSGLRVP